MAVERLAFDQRSTMSPKVDMQVAISDGPNWFGAVVYRTRAFNCSVAERLCNELRAAIEQGIANPRSVVLPSGLGAFDLELG